VRNLFISGLGLLIDAIKKHLYHCPYLSVNAERQYCDEEKNCCLSSTGPERPQEGITDFCKTYEMQHGAASTVPQPCNGAKHSLSQRQAKNVLYQSQSDTARRKRRNFMVRYGPGSASSAAVCAESRSAPRLLHFSRNRTLPVAINFPLHHKH
jgi:hypothetical protein